MKNFLDYTFLSLLFSFLPFPLLDSHVRRLEMSICFAIKTHFLLLLLFLLKKHKNIKTEKKLHFSIYQNISKSVLKMILVTSDCYFGEKVVPIYRSARNKGIKTH